MAESSCWRWLSIIAVKHYSGYYLACTRCKRKARRIPEYGENNVYKCPRCVSIQRNLEIGTHTSSLLLEWRYCVAINVTDGHMNSNVVAFGDATLKPVLGVSATELHQFLVENSKILFRRSEFDQTEVPEILYSSLQRLLVGRYFNFLVQQTNTPHPPTQPIHNCAVVSRIVPPLPTQPGQDLLTVLKCSHLGHELTENETTVINSTCHTPFCAQRELLYNCLEANSKDPSLIKIHSFIADDSDLCTSTPAYAATQTISSTQQTKEDTSQGLEMLCDLFTPLPSVHDNCITFQQPLASPLILSGTKAKLADYSSNPTDVSDSSNIDLPSDLDLQLEIVRQLEAEWLLTQTQVCASFSEACTEQQQSMVETCNTDTFSSTSTSQLLSPSSTEHIVHVDSSSRIESPELFSTHPTPSTPIYSSQKRQQQNQAPSPNCPGNRILQPIQLNFSSTYTDSHLATSSTPNNSKPCHSRLVYSQHHQQQEGSNARRKKCHDSTSGTQTPLTTHCDSMHPEFSPDIL